MQSTAHRAEKGQIAWGAWYWARFVRLYPPGKVPDLAGVQRTNFCDIGFRFDADSQRATIVAAIDNLTKGAAGQAVQNMNLMLGFEETEALL